MLTRVVTSEEEKEELRRRKLYLLYYLLYSPAYEARSLHCRGQRARESIANVGSQVFYFTERKSL